MRIKNLRCLKKIMTVLAVAGALFFATEPRTTFTQSGPLPQVTLNVPSEVLIGENFTFTVKFKNASTTPGDIGYGPFIDLVLDAGGANLNKNNPACACDGITFVKAEMVGVVGGPVSLNSFPVLAPCNPTPPNVPLSHPFASSGILSVMVPAGAQLITLELPFGSFDPTQPEIVVEVTAHVSNLADAGTPLKISARGGFRYGADPLDNPSTDPPILSDLTSSGGQQTDSTQWAAQATVTPTVITIGKKYLGPEDEAATGPNFTSVYPLQYAITVDIANGQTVSNVTVTDCFPNNLAFQSVVSVSPSGATVTPPPSGVPNNPPNNCLTVTWPSLTGASGPDATVVIEFFIPEKDANGNPVLPPNCQPAQSVNDVKAEGDWTPIDPCDTSPAHVVSDVTTSDHILADKCIAIQKKVAVFQDTGAPGPTPGDVLQYTLTFQISDFKTFGKLEIRDQLSDGQLFLPAPAPTLTVTDQFGTVSGAFIPLLDLFVTGDPNSTCQGIKGTTNLVFMVSQKMSSLLPSHPRHLAGILTGGWATTPTSSVPATGQIVFYARIQDQFSFPQNHPGDRFVDKDDPLANCVTIRGEMLTNVNPPMIPSPIGATATDDSETLTSIAADVITKTVYAVKRSGQEICGPTTSPCPAKPQVTPGDEVTFRIEKVIPSSDAENLTIQDWLPLPVFDVADPDANGTSGPPMSFSAAACGIPAPGQACLGPSNTLTVVPTFTSNVPTNSVTFNYGTFNDPTNTPRKIDLLFTLTATNDPFADGLFLTNQAQECEKNTFNMTFCQTAIAQVQMAEPDVRIIKGVVAADNPNAIFSPAAPPSGTFTPPGGSCSRFSGTINSSNIGSLNLNSNVSGVDANDTVTFAIVVENLGTGPNGVFDVKIRDIFPLGPTDLPSCFVPDFSTFCVTDGTGTPIPFTISPGGFGSVIIELTDPSSTQGALGPFHPTNGKNIAVLTFDAKLLSDIKSGCCDNRARLENYSNTENGPNFVTAGFGGPFEDTAQACVGPRPFAKCIQATSEAHTTPQSASQGGTVDATIGEIVRYRLVTVIPEGTTPSFQIQDFLPPGLTYLPGTARVLFVADSPVTSGVAIWPTVSGPNPPGCPGLPTPTANLLEGGAPFTPGTGADPIFFVGAQALPITNNDNDPNLEFVIIEFNAQVDNIASNQSSTTLANQFQVRFKDDAGNQFTSNSGPAFVHVVEPDLTITKTVSPSPVVQGGTVTYTLTITNTGTADAFDIGFTDTLPVGLTPVAGSLTFPTGCTGTLAGQDVTVNCATIPTGGSVTITYNAVATPATCPVTLTNQAKVAWTSLPGHQGTCPNPTGSCTAGTSGAIDGERDGSTAPNLPDKYAAAASATLTVTCPTGTIVINKATVGGDDTFTFTGSAGLPGNFTITTTSGAGTQTFSNLTTPGTYTVTESAPPAGWSFTSLTCTDPTNNTTISGSTATIVLDPGETVTCTFTNTKSTACVDPSSLPNMVAWWPLDEPNGAAVVNDLAGFNNQGTPKPGSPLGAANAPNAVAGQVGGAIQFNPNLQANGPHLEVQDHSELNPGTGDLSIDAWVRVSPSPPTAGFIYPIVDKLDVMLAAPNIGIPVKGYAFYLDNFVPLARLRFTMADGVTVANYIGPGIQYNAWNHVAVTVNRTSGTVTFYVNGTPTAVTAPPMPTGSIDTPGTTLLIGESRLGLQAEITIDELEIFKHVLTQQEIQAIYNGGSVGKCKCATVSSEQIACNPNGTFSYTATLTNVTNAVVTGINLVPPAGVTITPSSITTSLPPGQSITGTVTISGPNAQPGSTVCFDIVLTSPATALNPGVNCQTRHCITLPTCPGPGPCVPAPAGMTAWWPLNETSGTTVTDIMNGFNGTTQPGPIGGGGPGSISGMVGSSLFLGGAPYIQVPHNPNLDPGTGSFAVDFWLYWYTAGGSGPIIQKMTSTGEGWGVFIVQTSPSTANVEVRWKFASGTAMPVLSLPIAANQWYHVFAEMERNIVAPALSVLAVNGTFVNTGISVPPTDTIATTADLFIGGDPSTPGPRIAVDEVEIFGRSLTVQEVLAIFNAGKAGKCTDLSRVCVTKFSDLDGDGTQDPNEPLLSGWQFNVADQNNNPVGTLATSQPGAPPACLSVAAPGTYAVTEQVQSGWTVTTPNPQTVTVAPGQTVTVTFGNQGRAEICIFKFNDLNGDGKQDPNEPPLAGWQFTVSPAPLPPTTSPVTTGPQGSICFGVAAPGTYTITEQVQSGWTVTTPNPQTVTVTPGQLVNVSFGNRPQPGEICVVKFEDLDGDGVRDTNEPLLAGWQFTVTDASSNPVGTITTGQTQPTCLKSVAPGTYTVTETVQSGWTVTTPNPQTVTVAPATSSVVEFGNKRVTYQICGIKWNDLDGDGVKDPNEPGLPGWTINMVFQTPGGPLDVQTTTDANGQYCFTGLAPGTYTIAETLQPGWIQTFPPSPGTYTVTVPPSVTNINFGNKQGVCDREIGKSITPSPAQSGQQVTVTLAVTNVGTAACPAVAGVVLADPQPPGMTFQPPVSVTGSGAAGWSCFISGPSGAWPGGVQCTATNPLSPGAGVTITFTAMVTAPAGSQIENCAEVTNVGDANQANNKSCVTLQVTGCVTPPANMTAWWPLDETSGTTANDLAGVPNNGTHVNGPTPVPGKVAGALRFDGVNDHVRVSDHPELDVGTGNFTLDAWVRTQASFSVVVLVDKRSGPTPLGYSLFLSNGRLGFQMANGVGSSICAPTPTPGVACVNYVATAPNVADGQWHHVAAVVDRANATSGVRLYVDGVQVFAGAPLTGNLDNASDLYLGMRTPAQQGGGFFPGDLDEVQLIKRALTPQEIQAIFQAGAAGKCKQVLFPDFVVSDLRVIPPGIPGGPVPMDSQVQVSFAIVNQGTGEAGSASHQIRLIAGGGPVAEVNVLLATVMTGPLAAGASQSFNQLVTIPRDVPIGSARIRVIADAPNGVSESEEGNNVAEFPITLIRPPGT